MNNTVQINTITELSPCVNIYISAPYRGAPDVIEQRMRYIGSVIGALRAKGHFVTSALLHHWTIATTDENETSSYWLDYSRMLVEAIHAKNTQEHPSELWVLTLPGWEESSGVRVEIVAAYQAGMRIRYFEASWFDLLKEITMELCLE